MPIGWHLGLVSRPMVALHEALKEPATRSPALPGTRSGRYCWRPPDATGAAFGSPLLIAPLAGSDGKGGAVGGGARAGTVDFTVAALVTGSTTRSAVTAAGGTVVSHAAVGSVPEMNTSVRLVCTGSPPSAELLVVQIGAVTTPGAGANILVSR